MRMVLVTAGNGDGAAWRGQDGDDDDDDNGAADGSSSRRRSSGVGSGIDDGDDDDCVDSIFAPFIFSRNQSLCVCLHAGT